VRRLRIGDRLMRVRDEGESRRAPLVCVHGAGGSSVTFMDTVRRLAPRRRVVALDLPGHGQSDRWHPPDDVSVAMYRDAVGTVCANLKIERAVLVGHSMGGQVALACAAAWPERVAGVVIVASGAKLPVAARVFDVLERDYAHAPEWLARVSFSPQTPRELVERWTGLLLTAEQEIAIADFRAVDRFDGAPLAGKVRAPALVVGGEDDLMTPPALAHELARAIPGARAVVLPRAGHWPLLEQPDAFFAELDGFLVGAG
jgi:pimeloyl-ACP methyl ester carboxylesterase